MTSADSLLSEHEGLRRAVQWLAEQTCRDVEHGRQGQIEWRRFAWVG
jgi:hypothetical protein